MRITESFTFLNETMLVSRAVHFILEDRFQAGHYFSFISFSYCLVSKEEKKLIKLHYN